LGQYAQSQNNYAVLGLFITAVGVPFLGLTAMTLFNGNYKNFFNRMGPVPGFLIALAIMGLIGPFGAIPRCIALSYSAMRPYLPDIGLAPFSLLACIVIYLFSFKKSSILDVLGYVLTPLLLLSLAFIIIKGFITSPSAPQSDHPPFSVFLNGLKEGYQTMDLLGAFFFSTVVLECLEREVDTKNERNYRRIIFLTLKASCIGAFLLGIIYIGFSYIAAFNSDLLAGVNSDELLGVLAYEVLGSYGGIAASSAVALACLTTAIALSTVFAEFLQRDVCQSKMHYQAALILTLVLSFFISTFKFTGIVAILAPILQILYPALIVLSLVNILYKLIHFKPVKTPVFVTFLVSLMAYILY
jgi:branched-chain amino acid:cation transporter, LIVCS family